MVYNKNSTTTSTPYIEASASTKSRESRDKEIGLLHEYFSKLDGSPQAFENIQPLLTELFFPDDFKMVIPEKELNYDEFIEVLKRFCDNGCIANLESAEKNQNGDAVTIIINNILPNQKGDSTQQTASYKDGRIVRVEAIPSDSDRFGSMIGHVMDLPESEDVVIEKFRAIINAFDGSANALEKAKPLADEIFDPNVVFELSDTEKQDYDWYLRFLASMSREGNSAKLEKLERTNNKGEVRVIIHAYVNGQDMGSGERRMQVKNNKIVYVQNVSPSGEQQFRRLTDRAMASPSGNDQDDAALEKFRAFINSFDGSPDAFARAKVIMDDLYDQDFFLHCTEEDGPRKDYEWLLGFASQFASEGNVARIIELERTGSGLRAVIHNTVKGKDMGATEQRGIVRKGKIVYWEALPHAKDDFDAMVDRVVSEEASDRVIEKVRAFINAFDGSPDAFTQAKAVMDDLYNKEAFRARTEKDGPEKDYEWLLDFVAKYAAGRNVARMVLLEKTDTGLRTIIHNTVKGKDMGSTEQRGTVKNGKIVYWEAVPSDKEPFKRMVDNVMSN